MTLFNVCPLVLPVEIQAKKINLCYCPWLTTCDLSAVYTTFIKIYGDSGLCHFHASEYDILEFLSFSGMSWMDMILIPNVTPVGDGSANALSRGVSNL